MPLFNKNKDKEFAIIRLDRFGGSLARRLEALGHILVLVGEKRRLAEFSSAEGDRGAVQWIN
jgi:Trk K+ transport system NAD-binding subunit